MSRSAFREYDVRGVVGEQLDEAFYERLGRCFGTYLARHDAETVVVGHDVRPTSPAFAEALRRGLTGTGRRVLDVGSVTTPVVVFAKSFLGASASVAVTASHNPSAYNGAKLRAARPVHGAELAALAREFEGGRFTEGRGSVETVDVRDAYATAVAGRVRARRSLKVVVDAGNGAGGPVAPALLERTGFEVVPLHCDPDGTFPNHHPDPTKPENLEDLRETILAERADAGVALDGDADRVVLLDENGRIHWPDRMLMALAAAELPRHPGAVVAFDVKCSQGVAEVVTRHGGRPRMVKTGYPFLLEAMREDDALLGAELSGHVYFGRDRLFDFDDGVHAACRTLEVLARDPRPVSEQLAELPQSVSTPEIRLGCAEEHKFEVTARLVEAFRGDPDVRELVDIDGARVVYPEGWGLVRASNTEPSLVLVFEARDEDGLDRVKRRFAAVLEAFPEIRGRLG